MDKETKYKGKQEPGYNPISLEEDSVIEQMISSTNYFTISSEAQQEFIEANEKAKQMMQNF